MIYMVSDSVRAAGHHSEAALNHFFRAPPGSPLGKFSSLTGVLVLVTDRPAPYAVWFLLFFPFFRFCPKVLPLRLDFPKCRDSQLKASAAELRDIFLACFAVTALAPQSCGRPPRSLQIRRSSAESLKNVFPPLRNRDCETQASRRPWS